MNFIDKSLLCVVAGTFVLPAFAQQQKAKNLLFIIVDDMRPELGCYGEEHMITPNIDALAKDGTVFKKAYVQYAVSSATRASLLTGCYPDVTGVNYPYSQYFVYDFLPEHPSFINYMHKNGCWTRMLGKIHHGYNENLTERHYYPEGYNISYRSQDNIESEKQYGMKACPVREFLPLGDNDYLDGKVAEEAVATIRRALSEGERFCLAVGFLKPHLPFVAPKKYLDLYDNVSLPDCPSPNPTVGETEFSRSFYNVASFMDGYNDAEHPLTYEQYCDFRKAYFACVTFTDAQIGKVINELKSQGVYDDTAIILVGDHGWHLGDNCMWGKQTNYERATHAPLIIKDSEYGKQQVPQTDLLVEFTDIYPTACEMMGFEVPEFVEGTSCYRLLYDDSLKTWKKAALSQHPRSADGKLRAYGRTIRTSRYRYTEWRRNDELVAFELYDHDNDPYESVNVAAENQDVCRILSEQLAKGWRANLPDGIVNNSNNVKAPKSPAYSGKQNNIKK